MSEPKYWVRQMYSNGVQTCPQIWFGTEWITDVVGSPHLGFKSVEKANDICDKLNAHARLVAERDALLAILRSANVHLTDLSTGHCNHVDCDCAFCQGHRMSQQVDAAIAIAESQS